MENEKNFYFELKENEHDKFWAITLINNEHDSDFTLIRRWGRTGQQGRVMEENFSSFYSAEARRQTLVREKLAKGYLPIL